MGRIGDSLDHQPGKDDTGGEEADEDRCHAVGHEFSLLQLEDQEGRRQRAESADGLTAPQRPKRPGGRYQGHSVLVDVIAEVAGM